MTLTPTGAVKMNLVYSSRVSHFWKIVAESVTGHPIWTIRLQSSKNLYLYSQIVASFQAIAGKRIELLRSLSSCFEVIFDLIWLGFFNLTETEWPINFDLNFDLSFDLRQLIIFYVIAGLKFIYFRITGENEWWTIEM